MNRKVTVLLSVTFVALSVSVFAYTSCRDTTTGCTFEQLVQLNKDAVSLGLATSERVAIKQEMVTKLTTEIKQLTSSGSTNGGTNTSTATCVDLNNSLVIGSTDATTNGEVSKLQKFIGEYKVKKLYTIAPNNQSGASAEDLQPVSGYYGAKTAANVMEWQKDNGMDYVTPASGVGPTTRGKMKCGSMNPPSSTVQKINWIIEKANPNITDDNDYRKSEQAISVDVTFADNVTRHYKVGNAYGCTGSTTQSTENGKTIYGKVSCYFALSGVSFTMYLQNGRYSIDRGDESAKDGSVKITNILKI